MITFMGHGEMEVLRCVAEKRYLTRERTRAAGFFL